MFNLDHITNEHNEKQKMAIYSIQNPYRMLIIGVSGSAKNKCIS